MSCFIFVAAVVTLQIAATEPPVGASPGSPVLAVTTPWPAPEPRDVCYGIDSEGTDLYEVRDPKDPTANMRETPNGAVVVAVPVKSIVIDIVVDSLSDDWIHVVAAEPMRNVTGWVPSSTIKGDHVEPAPGKGLVPVLASPSSKDLPLAQLDARNGLRVVEKNGDWTKVQLQYRAVHSGFMHKSRLKAAGTRKESGDCNHPDDHDGLNGPHG